MAGAGAGESGGVVVVVSAGGGGVCRLCLCAARAALLADILPPPDPGPAPAPALHTQILLLTGVLISAEDNLPQKICYKCRYLVEVSYELRVSAIKANEILKDATLYYLTDDASLPSQGTDALELNTKTEPVETPGDDDAQVLPPLQDALVQGQIKLEDQNAEEPANDDSSSEKVEPAGDVRRKKKIVKSKHTWKHSDITQFTCQICLTTSFSTEKLTKHIRQHYEGSKLTPYPDMMAPYKCDECKQKLPNKIQLYQHHRNHLGITAFLCRHPGCSFIGQTRDKLRQHSYSHRPRSYVCERARCGAAFRRAFDLKQHSIRHADDGAVFPCRYCRVVCSNRITYRRHLMSHELGRRFKCDRTGCPKGFYSRSDLQVHRNSHENERIYRCSMCVSAYNSQSLLNRHLRMHEKLRTNRCDKCTASFDNYAAFYNHRVSAHGPWQPHRCPGCNQGYESALQLENHLRKCQLAINVELLTKSTQPSENTPTYSETNDRHQIHQRGQMDEHGEVNQHEQMVQHSEADQHEQTNRHSQMVSIDAMEEILIRNLKGHIVKPSNYCIKAETTGD